MSQEYLTKADSILLASNPFNYSQIGEIPIPTGFSRQYNNDDFANYLRSLPLKNKGSKVLNFEGEEDTTAIYLNYAVVDIPILNDKEECADACIRLRSEYLFQKKKFNEIRFVTITNQTYRYSGGNNRKRLNDFLYKVYCQANTTSIKKSLKKRSLQNMQPGDIFVFTNEDREKKYGHAVMVADLSTDSNGNIAILFVEGNNPARDMNLIHNRFHPEDSPWFIINSNTEKIILSPETFFCPSDLRSWQ